MRILSLVFSFLIAVSLAAAALTYLEYRVGKNRIQVQEAWISSSDEQGYRAYGETSR